MWALNQKKSAEYTPLRRVSRLEASTFPGFARCMGFLACPSRTSWTGRPHIQSHKDLRCARHRADCFPCVLSLSPHNTSVREVLLLTPAQVRDLRPRGVQRLACCPPAQYLVCNKGSIIEDSISLPVASQGSSLFLFHSFPSLPTSSWSLPPPPSLLHFLLRLFSFLSRLPPPPSISSPPSLFIHRLLLWSSA